MVTVDDQTLHAGLFSSGVITCTNKLLSKPVVGGLTTVSVNYPCSACSQTHSFAFVRSYQLPNSPSAIAKLDEYGKEMGWEVGIELES